ncbi:hypothetical protein E2C01_065966 [Portunus trituberculatus]|uniref:Uncharacterized protein n=1 Tax=Portunus trituberculatus TaxID=210409 RepID=A0A5B7HFZ0_PORTR|nr:hypothetical protein [Portunus trituberculatus]
MSEGTGYPQYLLLFSHQLQLPVEGLNLPMPLTNAYVNTSHYLKELQRVLHSTHKEVNMRSPKVNRNVQHPFSIGDALLVKFLLLHRHHKLHPCWQGPFTVMSLPSPFQITYNTGLGLRTVLISHVKLFHMPASQQQGTSYAGVTLQHFFYYDAHDSRTGQFSATAYDCRNGWEYFSARRTHKTKDVQLHGGLKVDVHSWFRRQPLHTHVQKACDV